MLNDGEPAKAGCDAYMDDVAWTEDVCRPRFHTFDTLAVSQFDLAVVGAGLAGVSAALHAAQRGMNVVLLEAKTVGSGASGRNAGFVVPHYPGLSPAAVVARLGQRRGAQLNTIVAEGAGFVFDQIRALDIDCEPVQNGWLQTAHSSKSSRIVQAMLSDWRALGADVRYVDAQEVAALMGTQSYTDGWFAPSGGYLNPYALTVGLAEAAAKHGVCVVEEASVLGISASEQGWSVRSGEFEVAARKVLLATNGYTGKQWGALSSSTVPIRLYATLSAELSANLRKQILPARPCVSDLHAAPRFSRIDARGRLISAGMASLTGNRRAKALRTSCRVLTQTFPNLEPVVDHYWEGVCAFTPSGLPNLYQLGEGAYAVAGFSGRGVSLAQALGPAFGALLSGESGVDTFPLDVVTARADRMVDVKRVAAPVVYKMLKQVDRFNLS